MEYEEALYRFKKIKTDVLITKLLKTGFNNNDVLAREELINVRL